MAGRVVLDLPPSAANPRNSEGAMATLRDGRIFFAYTRYTGGNADDAAADLACRTSDDGGRTWSSRDRLLVSRGRHLNVMSVSLLRLQDDRLGMLYLRKDRIAGQIVYAPLWCTSKDEGESWSRPVSISNALGAYVVNNDRVVQLRSGRLIVPAALHRLRTPTQPDPANPRRHTFAQPGLITFFLSDDGGETWCESAQSFYECFPSGLGLQEPGVLERRDGKIWCWSRAGRYLPDDVRGHQWEAFSSDAGHHWTKPKPSKTFTCSPGASPMSVKRHPRTGQLLALWNDRSGRFGPARPRPSSWGRTPLVSAVSDDDGKTWRAFQRLEGSPDHGYCYISIHFVAADDAVLLAYCSGGKGDAGRVLDRLRVRRVSWQQLSAG